MTILFFFYLVVELIYIHASSERGLFPVFYLALFCYFSLIYVDTSEKKLNDNIMLSIFPNTFYDNCMLNMFTLCTLISSFYFYRMMCYFVPYIFFSGELEGVIKPYSFSSKYALLIEKISNFISLLEQ